MRETHYLDTQSRLPPPVDAKANIRGALARGLPILQPGLFPHDGTAVLCGSGPSLPSFIEEIRSEREKRRPIVAVKGAHDILCEAGIEPDIYIHCEAKPRLENLKHRNARTLYLLATRCGPELFDHLAGRKVMVWHAWSPEDDMPELDGIPRIGGGTTSGLRAITVMWVLGFGKFALYGYDSCLSEDKRKRFYGEPMKDGQIVDRIVGGRRFLCNGAMAMQADEFQEHFKVMPGIQIDVKGDGLLAAIMSERAKRRAA